MNRMLVIHQLHAGYGGPEILRGVSMEVREGEIVVIIGPNGAGKSTLMRSIFGLAEITDGTIEYFGESLIGLRTRSIAKRGICYMPQGRSVFPSLTVHENLLMGAFIRQDEDIEDDIFYVYEKFPKLKSKRNIPARLLSGGEQQMVALGRSLMLRPKLLMLDEPSIGLAPNIIREVFDKCEDIRKNGTSILIVEQNAAAALEIADRGYVLELGENRLSGRGKELLADPKVGELYLGKRA